MRVRPLARVLSLAICAWASAVVALDFSPWFGRIYEFYPEVACRAQSYQRLETADGCVRLPSRDLFLDFSLEISPGQRWSAAAVLSTARTRHRSYGLNAATLIARYQLLDDVIGDPVSVVVGLAASQTFYQARRDLSVFNHGGPSGEVHLSFGREWSSAAIWTQRLWGLAAVGIADVGAPWWRFVAAAEANYCDCYRGALFLNVIQGLGNRRLEVAHFHGYGSLHYIAVDLAIRLQWYWEDGSYLSFGYAYRPFARNAPCHVSQIALAYTYPFGL